jgi:hypothetical protein
MPYNYLKRAERCPHRLRVMNSQLLTIGNSYISNMFAFARRCDSFDQACAELESYVLGLTTYGPEGQEWQNCPQDLYQTVAMPEGFCELEDEDADLVIEYLGDVWPSLWRDAMAW